MKKKKKPISSQGDGQTSRAIANETRENATRSLKQIMLIVNGNKKFGEIT